LSKFLRLILFVASGLAVAGLAVAVTLLVSSGGETELPPGCSRADATLPGCRPAEKGVSATTVAFAAVIASPLGAILAGLIAAASASRTQHSELERLDLQLVHEREIKDLEALRKLVDEALSSLANVTKHAGLISFAYQSTEESFSEQEVEEVGEARLGLHNELLDAIPLSVRMTTRLSSESPLVQSYDTVFEAASQINKAAYEIPPPSEGLRSEINEAFGQLKRASAEFQAAAVELARFRLPDSRQA
jgi:hypothetical protein